MINPGTLPVDNATPAAAAANMPAFVDAVLERGGQLAVGFQNPVTWSELGLYRWSPSPLA